MIKKSYLEKLKARQKLLLVSGVLVLGLLVMGLTVLLCSNKRVLNKPVPQSYKVPITSRLDFKEIWVDKFTAEQGITNQRMDNMEKMLQTLLKINQPVTEEPTLGSTELKNEIKQSLQTPLLQATPSTLPQGSLTQESLPLTQESLPQGSLSLTQEPSTATVVKRPHTKGIHKVSISLTNSKALKTSDNTIPAGAFAQSILLGGVDASTSIQASQDPRPVLLRITKAGTLPRKFSSDLCGCHVLAACYGDISGERVYMRLEKLTCTERRTGEIVEMNVNGYVAGEDGRAGLRGVVVDRAGESVRAAAIGGFLSGMGNFLSQAKSPVTYALNSGLAQSNPLSNQELLKAGVAKGATGALERYADFYIKRAEQMQPVIQVQAGRLVDIVFTQGVAFADSAARRAY